MSLTIRILCTAHKQIPVLHKDVHSSVDRQRRSPYTPRVSAGVASIVQEQARVPGGHPVTAIHGLVKR